MMRLAILLLACLHAAPAIACDYPGPPPGSPEARAEDGRGILWAGYSDATDRYDHGILGDAIEAGGLRAATADKGPCDLAVLLPETRVFEDVAPRLVDLDGDGAHEIVVVETDLDRGAQLAVYGLRGGALTKIAATPHIGSTHRWLAPAGAADLDGDGAVEIAYIDRPHLAKILRVWRYRDGRLTEVAAARGLTNHRIGEDYISGGIRDCGAGPEIITADADWRRIIATKLRDDALSARDIGRFSAAAIAAAMTCK